MDQKNEPRLIDGTGWPRKKSVRKLTNPVSSAVEVHAPSNTNPGLDPSTGCDFCSSNELSHGNQINFGSYSESLRRDVVVHAKLKHIEDVLVEHPGENCVVRALFVVSSKGEERHVKLVRVVLLLSRTRMRK